MFRVEYHLLDGRVETKTRAESAETFTEGQWISQSRESPNGLFVIASINYNVFRLEQVDCPTEHWRTKSVKELPRGKDGGCPTACKFYNDCKLTEYRRQVAMMAADDAD